MKRRRSPRPAPDHPALRLAPLGALLLLAAGCATPSTRPPSIDPALIRAEQDRQREAAFESTYRHQLRLDSLAYPLLRAAVPLCEDDARPWPAFRFITAGSFGPEWEGAARAVRGLDDTVQVFTVAPGGPADRAGLRPGDRLLEVNGRPVATGDRAPRELGMWLRDALPGLDTLRVRYRRDGVERTARLDLEPACGYETIVVPTLSLNAFADGRALYVTTAMIRFAEPDELASIVAHELAHNGMGHADARRRNAAIGGLFGLIGDILTVVAGDTLPDESYSSYYGGRTAQAYSRDFEREADYVGLYILALAGYDLGGAPRIFREFAIAEPSAIDYSGTHPSHTERFLLMEAAIDEIRRKQRDGEPVRPEPRP